MANYHERAFMLTEFLRDQFFTTAWFGLMSFVWFGWAQEDPPRRWRVWLGAGSALGIGLAVAFGVLTSMNWDSRPHWKVSTSGSACWSRPRSSPRGLGVSCSRGAEPLGGWHGGSRSSWPRI